MTTTTPAIKKRSKLHGYTMMDYMIILLLLPIFIITLYPVIYTVSVSISSTLAVEKQEVWLWPIGFNLGSYMAVFKQPEILSSFGNSFFYTICTTAYSMFLTICCAYALSRNWLYGRNVLAMFFAFTMWFGGGLIPYYLLLRNLKLLDTRWVLIIPAALNVWNMIIMRTSMQQIPESVEESAKIDGANDLTILAKIMIPMNIPVIATVTLFYIVGNWNSWFYPLIFLSRRELLPMPVIVRELLIAFTDQTLNRDNFMGDSNTVNPVSFRSAVVVLTMLPLLAVYPFIQRYFIKGIMIGSVKG